MSEQISAKKHCGLRRRTSGAGRILELDIDEMVMMRPWQPDFASVDAALPGCTRTAVGVERFRAHPVSVVVSTMLGRRSGVRNGPPATQAKTATGPCCASTKRSSIRPISKALPRASERAPGALRPHCDRPARWLRYVLQRLLQLHKLSAHLLAGCIINTIVHPRRQRKRASYEIVAKG